jgi:hypothetical protein
VVGFRCCVSVLAGTAGSLGVIEERRWSHIIFLRRGINLLCNKIRKTRNEKDLLLLNSDFNYIAIIRGENSTKGLNIYRN